jgi:hypothetical protein
MDTNHGADTLPMLTTAITGRPIPCWARLKPAHTAIDGHPYCAACIEASVPQQTRYLPGQEDRRAAGNGGTDWGGDPSVDPRAGR